jgi:hypothetical protein
MDRTGGEKMLVAGILIGAAGMLALISVGLVVALAIGQAIRLANEQRDAELTGGKAPEAVPGERPLLGVVPPPGGGA